MRMNSVKMLQVGDIYETWGAREGSGKTQLRRLAMTTCGRGARRLS